MGLQKLFGLILLSVSVAGCGSLSADGGSSGGSSSALFGAIGSEGTYCSTVSTPSPATTITSTAQFYARQVSSTLGLLGPSAAQAIRYAEVQVLNSAGNIIQCGTTDGSGAISVDIPQTAGTYTLKVLSRSNNSYSKASVLNNPTSMTPYSISASFTLAAAQTTKAVTLTAASYQSTLEGGAFNILDQIYLANEYIRNNSTCASLGNVCTAFTVASKVRVFWTPGLSPGAYYGSPTSSISFFIPSDDTSLGMATGIYLMGGSNGSTCVDTDHFDNSIIIHEFGHFLEKTAAYSDSPGGSHSGNGVIDPRLAWSEGWSNFLQGAVRGDNHYIDTHGNQDCSGGTGVSVSLNLETITAGQDAVSGATYLGEGIFREVSVSRMLWDTMDSTASTDTYGADVGFAYIWKVFSDSSSGFANSSVRFRNIGHFNEFMRALINTSANSHLTDYDNAVSHERQRADRREYAYLLTAQSGGSCTFDLQGVSGTSNYAKTNDFMAYYYDGTAAHANIRLVYAATPAGTPTDLDLYVWSDGYSFTDSSTMAGQSARFYPESGGSGLESISLSGKSAGYYLIQIMADPDNVNTTARYYLDTNGGSERLCP